MYKEPSPISDATTTHEFEPHGVGSGAPTDPPFGLSSPIYVFLIPKARFQIIFWI